MPRHVRLSQRQIIRSPESSASTSSSFVILNNRPASYKKISVDKKNILIKCYNDGKTIGEAAEIAGINKSTGRCIINQYNKNGGMLVEKLRGGKRNEKLTAEILQKIEQIIEENPCITLKNICAKIHESNAVVLSASSVRNALKKLRITLKSASLHVDRRNAQPTIQQRKIFAINFSQNAPHARERIIFIDESGFNCHLRRAKARSKVNTPARVTVPTVRGRNVSLVAAMSIQGIVFHKTVRNSNVDANIFCDFLGGLFEKLEQINIANAWLILDNASIHKTQVVRDLVGTTSHTLIFLPPYSPMLNPIEEVFSKIKLCARNMLADPGNQQNLVEIITESVATVTPSNCNNYYLNMSSKLPLAATAQPL